jgi:hypothetical protein
MVRLAQRGFHEIEWRASDHFVNRDHGAAARPTVPGAGFGSAVGDGVEGPADLLSSADAEFAEPHGQY